jgi:hypothetical protein
MWSLDKWMGIWLPGDVLVMSGKEKWLTDSLKKQLEGVKL